MRILNRKTRILQPPETKPNPVLMRFLTHGGATVKVTYHSGASFPYWARCWGCGWDAERGSEHCARDVANFHAAECRSMPMKGVTR